MTDHAASRSLKQAAVRSSFWSLAGFGGSQLMRFVSNVTFTYLLYEEAFALMMLVNAVTQGLAMFTDIGLGPSVIQHERGDDKRFLGTAFTLQVARGALLAVVCLALTYPVAAGYAANDPAAWDLMRLLPLAALSVFLSSFTSMRMVTASRHLAVGRVVRIDLVSQFVAIATTLLWAWFDRDVLALLVGNLAGTVTKVMASHLAMPGPRDRFAWDPLAARAILRFGGWILVSTAMSFLAMQIDRLVFAGAFSFGEAGIYHVAVNITAMVPMIIGSMQLSVVFPLYSRMANSGQELQPALIKIKGAVFTISGVLVAGMMACGATFIDVVYDDRWQEAGWIVSLLAIGGWFSILESMYGAAMLARGKVQLVALSNVGKPIVFLAIYLLGRDQLGVRGFVLATVAAEVARGLLSMWGARQIGALTWRLDVSAAARTFAIGAMAWLLARHLSDNWGWSSWLVLPVVGTIVVACHSKSLKRGVVTLREARS